MSYNPSSVVLLTESVGGLCRYNAGSDNLSTVEGFGYFNGNHLRDNQIIAVIANDGRRIYRASSGALILIGDVSSFEWE